MVKKEFKYYGKTLEELKKMSMSDFIMLTEARARRALKRGMRESGKKLMTAIKDGKKDLRTHNREFIIIPQMVGTKIGIYNGRTFESVEIQPEMIGHRLGEFAMTRKSVHHTAPGIGATKSSANVGKK
jgi:small subunit ribosomal protein S19